MLPSAKNIIIFLIIGGVVVGGYVFFFRDNTTPEDALISTSSDGTTAEGTSPSVLPAGQEFLTLLLNVRNIRLDDSIFADPAFATLRDSSIILIQEGNEGRPNPFAPIGNDVYPTPVSTTSTGAPAFPSTGPSVQP